MGISIAVPGDRASADSVRISYAARCNNQPVVRGIRIAGVVPMANEPADLADQLAKEGYGEAGELRELLPVVYLDLKRIAHSPAVSSHTGGKLVHDCPCARNMDQACPGKFRLHPRPRPFHGAVCPRNAADPD